MKNLINYGDGPRAIYELLKQQIISGELKAEQELKIMPLAEDMGISIVPLREAIRMLAAERLVEMRPRRSPIVARLDVHDLVEMNQIRGALEPYVLADAVARHTSASLAECEAILNRSVNISDPWEAVELNKAFHMGLLEPSRYKRSLDIISDQYDGIARVTHYRVIAHGDWVGKLHDEHHAIFSAVQRRQRNDAEALMSAHIASATARAKAELEQENTDADQVPGQPLVQSSSGTARAAESEL